MNILGTLHPLTNANKYKNVDWHLCTVRLIYFITTGSRCLHPCVLRISQISEYCWSAHLTYTNWINGKWLIQNELLLLLRIIQQLWLLLLLLLMTDVMCYLWLSILQWRNLATGVECVELSYKPKAEWQNHYKVWTYIDLKV